MTRMRPISTGEKARIRDSWDSLLGSASGLGTSITVRRDGANRAAQDVRIYKVTEEAEGESIPSDVAVLRVRIVGDLTLSLRAGDTFSLGGKRFTVTRGAEPEMGADWNLTGFAEVRL
jgi:hypothetical protein